ncbi:MAG: Sapep family Mn(2+)-dependent dipeptidase [Coriobacteriales bacterium]|jgi:predicted dipeptidase
MGKGQGSSPVERVSDDGGYDELSREVDRYIDEVWDGVVSDIAEMVSHPSVAYASAATPEDPYGPDAHAALRCALGIASRLGLDAHDCDGHIGYADVPGKSDEYVATIAHCDVVPAGEGWTADPFSMRRREGYLIGRGVMDDKGPLVLSLYAAHFFAQRRARGAEPLPYTLRAIVGSDEEVGCSDVPYYLERFPEPLFLFTPDANFPVGVGEKGHLTAAFVSAPLREGRVVSFDAGHATNAIPGLAKAAVRADASRLPHADGIEVAAGPEGLALLTAHGRGGHASMPQGTVNAIGMIVSYLRDNGLLSSREAPFFDLLALVFASTDGSTLGIGECDELFGAPTCIGGTIHMVDGRLEQTVDTRYTTALTGQVIMGRLEGLAARYGATLRPMGFADPYVTSPDSEPVRALLDVYDAVTGRRGEPLTMGGGTYARLFAHAVSFGPNDVDDARIAPDWVGPEHGPDEGISEASLRRALKVYILAIARLMGLSYRW